ncbi:hypothetical protein PGB90_004533 [Kerria lacca]
MSTAKRRAYAHNSLGKPELMSRQRIFSSKSRFKRSAAPFTLDIYAGTVAKFIFSFSTNFFISSVKYSLPLPSLNAFILEFYPFPFFISFNNN